MNQPPPRPPWRVIQGGAQPAPEPPAHLPADLHRAVLDWFFSELGGVTDMEHARLLQRRLESVAAVCSTLTKSLSGALDAASAAGASERIEAFFASLRSAQAKLDESLAACDS